MLLARRVEELRDETLGRVRDRIRAEVGAGVGVGVGEGVGLGVGVELGVGLELRDETGVRALGHLVRVRVRVRS